MENGCGGMADGDERRQEEAWTSSISSFTRFCKRKSKDNGHLSQVFHIVIELFHKKEKKYQIKIKSIKLCTKTGNEKHLMTKSEDVDSSNSEEKHFALKWKHNGSTSMVQILIREMYKYFTKNTRLWCLRVSS